MNLLFFGIWIKDANCPFRFIKKDVLVKALSCISPDTLAPNIFISIFMKKEGYKIKEVDVTHNARMGGVGSLGSWKIIRFSYQGFKQLMDFRNQLQKGG